jgi:hypothetical protein
LHHQVEDKDLAVIGKKQNRRQFIQGTITTTAGLAAVSSLGPFAYSATA